MEKNFELNASKHEEEGTPEEVKQMLKGLRELVDEQGSEELFESWRDLLGFKIGWIKPTPEVLAIIEESHPEFDYDGCEIVLIHNHAQGDCHLHEVGASNFLVLGESDGFEEPDGGIMVADYVPGQTEYDLNEKRLHEGDYLNIPPKQVHAFFVDSGTMSVLGVVNPKIKQGENEFDIVDFDYTDGDKRHVVQQVAA